ncbi:MAG TPA: heme-binding protein [Phycisphaerales bacterium]|nr:heme-binding protein [Phycisphaerales bacterium]
MRIRKRILFGLIFLLPFFVGSCVTVGIEKSKYTVIQKQGKFEIRQYEPQIVAETIVDTDFGDAGNAAFRRLFNYISGDNQKKESIKMTAPVSQKSSSEKISMTAPVNQQKSEDKYVVSFLMPGKYTMDALPEPLDSSVKLRQVPARKIAAVRYSGSWSRKRYESHKGSLEEFIRDKNLTKTGEEPIWARYDPPFQLWFLRRNEVLIPIE